MHSPAKVKEKYVQVCGVCGSCSKTELVGLLDFGSEDVFVGGAILAAFPM